MILPIMIMPGKQSRNISAASTWLLWLERLALVSPQESHGKDMKVRHVNENQRTRAKEVYSSPF